ADGLGVAVGYAETDPLECPVTQDSPESAADDSPTENPTGTDPDPDDTDDRCMIDLDTARVEVDRALSSPFADEFAELFARQGAAALERHGGGHHVTASCLVFDPIADSVLLNHHGKAQLWGQFGGHLEPVDVSLPAAPQREADADSGMTA